MLDFHAFEEGNCFRNQLEIISEEINLEHAGEVSG